MEIQFEYRNQTYVIDADRDDNMATVQIGDKTFEAEICHHNGHSLLLKIDGKNYEVHFAANKDERYLSVNGRDYIVKRQSKRKKSGGVDLAATQDLTAPMPGKVLKILVENEDMVEAGQPLLILEAMKMEYTIKAHQAGRVVGLELQADDQVDLGQVLLDIEAVEK